MRAEISISEARNQQRAMRVAHIVPVLIILAVLCLLGLPDFHELLASLPLVLHVQLPLQAPDGGGLEVLSPPTWRTLFAGAPRHYTVALHHEGSFFGQRWPDNPWGRPEIRSCHFGSATIAVVSNPATALCSNSVRRGCTQIDASVRVFHTADYQNRRELAALRRAHPRDLFVHESREVPVIFPADVDPVYMSQVRTQHAKLKRIFARAGIPPRFCD